MAERFYLNCKLQTGLVCLGGPEARHLSVVCRARPGDPLVLFNGDGFEYRGHVVEVGRREVCIEIHEVAAVNRELDYLLQVAAPLPKGDRSQFLIEKLTELGATSFVPLQTERSVVHPRESKLEKLHRYVIEASTQCRRNALMQVSPLTEWSAFCHRSADVKLLAHPDEASTLDFKRLPPLLTGCTSVSLAVGPEGGFTQDELHAATESGWNTLDMGPRILRMETAAITLASWIVILKQL